MTFGAMVAMMRDRGLKDEDEVQLITGYFNGTPAVEMVCDVWPVDHADARLNIPKTIDFHRRPKDTI